MTELTTQMRQTIKKYMDDNSSEFQQTIAKAFPKEEAESLNCKYAQLIEAIMPKLISYVISENQANSEEIISDCRKAN